MKRVYQWLVFIFRCVLAAPLRFSIEFSWMRYCVKIYNIVLGQQSTNPSQQRDAEKPLRRNEKSCLRPDFQFFRPQMASLASMPCMKSKMKFH